MSRVKNILEGIAKSGRVAGAYLFVGPPGAGKKESARAFAQILRCAKQDIFVIAPGGKSLKIDQVRDLQALVRYGPSAGPYLAVIVEKADTLTDQAAAAFLKTLEEPAPGVVFILLAERGDRIPATIASRCQKLVFSERTGEWNPDGVLNPFYEEIRSIRTKSVPERFKLSSRMEKERERIDEVLYDLSYFMRYELSDAPGARIVLDTLRFIKRRANLKLALDIMCLKLGEANVR